MKTLYMKNGEVRPVFDINNVLDVVDEFCGDDTKNWIEEYVNDCETELNEYKQTATDYEQESDGWFCELRNLVNELQEIVETEQKSDKLRRKLNLLIKTYNNLL